MAAKKEEIEVTRKKRPPVSRQDKEFDHYGIRITLQVEPSEDGFATIVLFIDDKEVQDSKTRIPTEEVDGFFERLKRSITSTNKG